MSTGNEELKEPAEAENEPLDAVEADSAFNEKEIVESEDELLKQLKEAEKKAEENWELLLRTKAEMENLRKRTLRDAEKSRKFALERIMKELLQVRDSMERGLEMADESATVESLIEGEKLTLRMLAKLMQDNGLEVVDPVGEPFDPELHEAMTVMPSAEVAENTVLEVLQKGFKLHERLIRPARVIVSSKA